MAIKTYLRVFISILLCGAVLLSLGAQACVAEAAVSKIPGDTLEYIDWCESDSVKLLVYFGMPGWSDEQYCTALNRTAPEVYEKVKALSDRIVSVDESVLHIVISKDKIRDLAAIPAVRRIEPGGYVKIDPATDIVNGPLPEGSDEKITDYLNLMIENAEDDEMIKACVVFKSDNDKISAAEAQPDAYKTVSELAYITFRDRSRPWIEVFCTKSNLLKIERIEGVASMGGTYFMVLPGDNNSSAWFTPGDVDLDRVVGAADARLALRNAVGLDELDEVQLELADLDSDGFVTVRDARMILRRAVGLT